MDRKLPTSRLRFRGKEYKCGKIIDQIKNKIGSPERIRLTIPRACQFVYEIASNRGARHDADQIDENEMDATVVMSVCAWILSEMVSIAQKRVDLAEAKAIVEGLMRREFPFTERLKVVFILKSRVARPKLRLLSFFTFTPSGCRRER